MKIILPSAKERLTWKQVLPGATVWHSYGEAPSRKTKEDLFMKLTNGAAVSLSDGSYVTESTMQDPQRYFEHVNASVVIEEEPK